jgi:hypothetical protein
MRIITTGEPVTQFATHEMRAELAALAAMPEEQIATKPG